MGLSRAGRAIGKDSGVESLYDLELEVSIRGAGCRFRVSALEGLGFRISAKRYNRLCAGFLHLAVYGSRLEGFKVMGLRLGLALFGN